MDKETYHWLHMTTHFKNSPIKRFIAIQNRQSTYLWLWIYQMFSWVLCLLVICRPPHSAAEFLYCTSFVLRGSTYSTAWCALSTTITGWIKRAAVKRKTDAQKQCLARIYLGKAAIYYILLVPRFGYCCIRQEISRAKTVLHKMALEPYSPFCDFRASKSADRHFWTTYNSGMEASKWLNVLVRRRHQVL